MAQTTVSWPLFAKRWPKTRGSSSLARGDGPDSGRLGALTLRIIPMLNELVVEQLGVIKRAELSLDRGCSALTGETGAGKTLLVAALSLLLGARGDRSLVRTGAIEARADGRFSIPAGHSAVGLLRAHGVLDDGNDGTGGGEIELVVSRTVPADGRSGKARINGRLVTVSLLTEVGPALVEIAGQHEHQRLGASAYQRAVLDQFAGPATVDLASRVSEAVGRATAAADRAAELRASERERSRELDVLRYEINEIENAAIEPGESARLAAEASRLEHAETIAESMHSATQALRGEGGAEELVAGAAARLRGAGVLDEGLVEVTERLETAGYELADVADDLARRAIGPDPDALEAVQARQAALARLGRKYGDDESEVLDYLDRARSRADELGDLVTDLEATDKEARVLRKAAEVLADRLSAVRREAAPRLARAVEDLLADLALGGATFQVSLENRPLYEGGTESVEFRIATSEGETLRPVSRVASGGELSRVALALYLLGAREGADTMVFDEVDAGVGGRAAQSVGRALADLARRTGGQVLVVTHLPQVAAFADRHYRVDKNEDGGRSTAMVEEVSGDNRVAELSRMLAGLPKSERAREHAQELLELARAGAA
jgi:DNA repair protein RecN (Recombination protein N)